MFIDFRELEDGAAIEADLCIIGAGAAGITIAQALVSSGLSVALLEGGGMEPDDAIQGLYDGEAVGIAGSGEPGVCRLRYFGGTTNHWAGWCAPLGELDFQVRPWVPHSGWPVARAELDPYYEAAHQICDLGPYDYSPKGVGLAHLSWPEFDQAKALLAFRHVGPPTRFGEKYRDELAKAENVRVYLHANMVELEPNADSLRVEAIHLRTLEGRTGIARAPRVVLACGGIENARLLLLSDRVESNGLGNRSGLVGRFFMQHPHATVGRVVATNEDVLVNFVLKHKNPTARSVAGIAVSRAKQEELGTLNCMAQVLADADTESGFVAFREIWRTVRSGSWPDDMPEKLRDVVLDIDDVAGGIYYHLRDRVFPGEFLLETARLKTLAEQAPNPDSRVMLAGSRDALGLRRARVDWRLTELDRRTAHRSAQLVAEELGRLGLGRVGLHDWVLRDDAAWGEDLWGGCHHLGTTRMADDPTKGVVDRNCRVHSIDNLYIAGSSVFPTTGWANPTLTIVALALRLAEHLKERSAADG